MAHPTKKHMKEHEHKEKMSCKHGKEAKGMKSEKKEMPKHHKKK